jgi:hypothetical protein
MGKTEALRCERGANCVSYPTLGEPSKLSRANPGPRCFACEEHRMDFEVRAFEVEAVAAKAKATKHRQVKRPSRSEGYEPKVRSWAGRLSERASTEGADAAFVGHHHAEESRALAIRERRRASVLTCERGLHSAIDSGDARLRRTWSKALREAEDRLLWAEEDVVEASEKSA